MSVVTSAAEEGRDTLFGHPRWFTTLFLTDVWERFSFYGMQAILVLYAVAPARDGGLGLPKSQSAMLFGVYLGAVFLLSLPGSWVGDRLIGERRAVFWGGCVIALGHFSLAVPARGTSYLGLALVALGTALLKPNMMAIISRCYEETARREAAISVFYTATQISALIAPLVTGVLGETVNWHLGFSVAGIGMVAGLVQFAAGRRHFGDVGDRPGQPVSPAERRTAARRTLVIALVVVTLIAVDVAAGTFDPMQLVGVVGVITLVSPFVYYRVLRRHPDWRPAERRRLRAFLWLLLAVSLFWTLAGQAGSLLSLFAKNHTDRTFGGVTIPASWFQSATPLFILLMAPVCAYLWLRLGSRLGTPAKFAVALLLGGCGFVVMSVAAGLAGSGRVSPLWLLSVFFLQACGEIVIGPIAMSAAAEVAPKAFVGRTIGLVWLFSALGSALGSQGARLSDALPGWVYYLSLGAVTVTAGVAITAFGAGLRQTFSASHDYPDRALTGDRSAL
ncbi:peptide MFS transporter [Actinoallomurus vinaceus]|uniref:peptide MFS transporter n=1 Tax=Actinoallomurus vinaceus TaxID=1080074 RepID=UPI0031EA4A12